MKIIILISFCNKHFRLVKKNQNKKKKKLLKLQNDEKTIANDGLIN